VSDEQMLHLECVSETESVALNFAAKRVICAGYSGRRQESVQEHIRELAALGMPAPPSTPMFFQVSNYLATTTACITVQDRLTSGEVEFALLFDRGRTYVTCGSDHTHRELERHSIPGAKQMHPKILARVAWPLAEVTPQWDQLTLRSWATLDGTRRLYQEGPLAEIMDRDALLNAVESRLDVRRDGTVFMSGTIPTIGGLVYAEHFEFELRDSVRDRAIRHAYDIQVMD
jgi:hypothetical protein